VAHWSNPATWGGKTPQAGSAVVIPAGQRVLLDVSPPPLRSLEVNGALAFDARDLALMAEWILVRGELRIGAPGWPHTHKAVITLTGDGFGESVHGLGSKFLAVAPGATLEMHGEWRVGWAKLSATAGLGATQLLVAHQVNWRAGDHIVIAASADPLQAEARFIRSVRGNLITLDQPLQHQHWGALEGSGPATVDARADVGLLSRNLVIRGENAGSHDFGGFIYCMRGSRVRLDGLELTGLGQRRAPSRFPLHLYTEANPGDAYLCNSSLHHNFQHGILVYRASHAVIQHNVLFDEVGQVCILENNLPRGDHKRKLGVLTRTLPLERDEFDAVAALWPRLALTPALGRA
jgi:hypothetical protein